MADGDFWHNRLLLVSPGVHRLEVGSQAALFCERRQQLYQLNSTADALWQALTGKKTPATAIDELAEGSLELAAQLRRLASGWIRSGHFVPAEILQLANRQIAAELHLVLHDVRATIQLVGDADPDALRAVFGQFSSAQGGGRRFVAVGCGGLVFLLEGSTPLGAWDEEGWIPEIKALLTQAYTNIDRAGFAGHAALLSRGGASLLLIGAPGAGKTTLTVTLAQAGFDYHADDIVRFDMEGAVTGLPFCPALKEGSWPLLKEAWPAADGLKSYRRSDGKWVKYLPVDPAKAGPLTIDAILLLARVGGADAEIEPAEPLEALLEILGSAFSVRHSIDHRTLASLTSRLGRARVGRLRYSESAATIELIEAFLR